jgi:manganese transport protein
MPQEQASATEVPSKGTTRLRKYALVGPAIIIGALQFGPGNVVSATTVGAHHGYSVLWLVALSGLLMFAMADMGVRIGIASKDSMLQAVRAALGPVVTFAIAVACFIIATLFLIGSLTSGAVGLNVVFGGSIKLWSLVLGVLGLAVFWSRNAYRRLEKSMIAAMATMVVVFLVTAVLAKPSIGDIARGFIPSAVSEGRVDILALLGTSLSVTAAFYAVYTIREKGTRRAEYRATTLVDTLPGVGIPAFISVLIVIAAAAVIPGRSVEESTDFISILEPAVGDAAKWIFAIGILAAGFASVLGNSGIIGSVIPDAMNHGSMLNTRSARLAVTAVLTASVSLVIIFGGAPFSLVITANALVLLFFPFIGAAMLYMANKKSVMGDLRNNIWQNILCGAAYLVILLGAVQLGFELFS